MMAMPQKNEKFACVSVYDLLSTVTVFDELTNAGLKAFWIIAA